MSELYFFFHMPLNSFGMDDADDIGNVSYLCEHGPQDCHNDQQKTPIAQMTKTSKGFLVEPLTAEFELS